MDFVQYVRHVSKSKGQFHMHLTQIFRFKRRLHVIVSGLILRSKKIGYTYTSPLALYCIFAKTVSPAHIGFSQILEAQEHVPLTGLHVFAGLQPAPHVSLQLLPKLPLRQPEQIQKEMSDYSSDSHEVKRRWKTLR